MKISAYDEEVRSYGRALKVRISMNPTFSNGCTHGMDSSRMCRMAVFVFGSSSKRGQLLKIFERITLSRYTL